MNSFFKSNDNIKGFDKISEFSSNNFKENIIINGKKVPKSILGVAPFTGESYFGHRSRLYQLDLHINPKAVANIIKTSYDLGVSGINLNTDERLLDAWEEAISMGVNMKVIGTVSKTLVDYVNPNYEKAIENAKKRGKEKENKNRLPKWKEDIDKLSKFDTPLMLIDEFIVDSYDWDFINEILDGINDSGSLAGLITAYPFKTTKKLIELRDSNSNYKNILNKFDFYMIPTNKLGYMMDSQTFMEKEREELSNLLKELDKKVIINKLLAAGIQMPNEAINFLNSLDYADAVAIGIGSTAEAEETFNALFI